MDMTQELKPCPFCGSSNLARSVDGGILPDFIDSARFDYREKPYYITCTLTCDDCGAMLQGYTATGKHEDCDPDDAIDDAYNKWNTRAERTCEMVKLADYSEYVAYRSGIYVCSRCGKKSVHESSWGYCPNCGAKVVE